MRTTILALKTTSCIALVLGCVACGENGRSLSPTGPSALPGSSLPQASASGFSARDESRLPAIVVADGISCPSDAPNVLVGGNRNRIDIEWSPIPSVSGYQIVVERLGVTNDWTPVQTFQTTAVRQEWYAPFDSKYRVHVRSQRCGDFGVWSSWQFYTVTELPPPGSEVATALLTNGSFEDGFAGWSGQGNLFVVGAFKAPVFPATDGTKLMNFNGNDLVPNGVLSQTFATTPGHLYTLAFDFGAYSTVNTDTQSIMATLQGATTLLSQTVSVAAPGNGTALNWVSQNFTFVADSPSTTLIFNDVSPSTNAVDLTLDNVRIIP